MADSTINVLTLGEGGVDVDTDSILTADNATRQSQNATFDPTRQRAGALVKRMGLDRFNTVPLAGAILGGIEAPFAGTAGAPASGGGGGGAAGDSGGTTAGQPPIAGGYGGGPGSNGTPGGSTSTGPSAIPPQLFPPPSSGKYVLIGRDSNLSNFGTGWYSINKGFIGTAQLYTSTGPPGNGYALEALATTVGYPRGAVGQVSNHPSSGVSLTEGLGARPNGVLFYPQAINPNGQTVQTGTGAGQIPNPVIRRCDGATDVAVATIPFNSYTAFTSIRTKLNGAAVSGSTTLSVVSTAGFPLGGGTLLVTTTTGTAVKAPYSAQVTGAQFNLDQAFGTGAASGSNVGLLNYGMQVLAMGTRYGDGSKVYIAVLDRLAASGSVDSTANYAGRVLELDVSSYGLTEVFNSFGSPTGANYNLFSAWPYPLLSGLGLPVWFGGDTAATGSQAQVYALVPSPAYPDGFANWAGYDSGNGDVTCLAEYRGSLWIGRSNSTGAFAVVNANSTVNGGSGSLSGNPQLTATGGTAQPGNYFVSMAVFLNKLYVSYYNPGQAAKIYQWDGTTWTAVFAGGTVVPYNLQLDNDGDILYAFGGLYNSSTISFLTSVDGVTWVDKTTNFPTTNNSTPINIFGSFIA